MWFYSIVKLKISRICLDNGNKLGGPCPTCPYFCRWGDWFGNWCDCYCRKFQKFVQKSQTSSCWSAFSNCIYALHVLLLIQNLSLTCKNDFLYVFLFLCAIYSSLICSLTNFLLKKTKTTFILGQSRVCELCLKLFRKFLD